MHFYMPYPSPVWKFSAEPFPAFRANISHGRNKFDRAFLSTKVAPVPAFAVRKYGSEILYHGTDREAAQAACGEYQQVEDAGVTLPAHTFRVIRTKEKGTILIVPGEDTSDRCLCFLHCFGGFRGGVDPWFKRGGVPPERILAQAGASNACDSTHTVVAILEPGESVAFHVYGRRENDVVRHLWDGVGLKTESFPLAEWQAAVEEPADAAAEAL